MPMAAISITWMRKIAKMVLPVAPRLLNVAITLRRRSM